MLKEVMWSDDRSYRTSSEAEPIQFYIDGLCNSIKLDLLLGYFSSAAINVLSLGFATFLYKGGNVRMIVNNILSQEDRDAIKSGIDGNIDNITFDLSDIGKLKNTLDEYGKHFFECLSWLISNKKIQIKIIKPKSGKGIAHYKSGSFYDGVNTVAFKASCNFTAFGLLENLEELDAFLSWENSRSSKMINRQYNDFEDIFSGKSEIVDYLDVENVLIAIKNEFGNSSINELVIKEKELVQRKSKVLENRGVKKSFQKAINNIDEIVRKPKFPFPSGPRQYQMDAYNNWVGNGFQGIFAMATGTGKTITSLNCLLQETYKDPNNIFHALILVPTITLVNQWEEEARRFNYQDIIKVASKYQWESELATTISTSKRIPLSFIVIATYASFVKTRFYKYIKEFPSDTILIADEAHNIGSSSVLEKLPGISFNKRIGLSATPKRNYDLEGSIAMEKFFNDNEPYTYTFSMERAIEEGILCKYYYYPHIVSLTSEELLSYIDISKKLAKFFSSKSDNFDGNDIVQKLLLKRKRIIHKAVNKQPITIRILKKRFEEKGNLKYSFIYVPEGSITEIDEDGFSDDETIKIINQYTREIGKISNTIKVNQFISGMADRDEILDQFRDGKIDVIASMKCLDEGVDIPRAEFAIFCSSTGNPRQFIQRRGRILRTHPQKDIAYIHDLVVIPDLMKSDKNSETFKVEKSMVEKELERVVYFSSLSINPFETENVFKEICEHYDLNIYTIYDKLKNND